MKRVGLGLSLAAAATLACASTSNEEFFSSFPQKHLPKIILTSQCVPQVPPVPVKLRFNSFSTQEQKKELIDMINFSAHEIDSTENFVLVDTATAQPFIIALSELEKFAKTNPANADTITVYAIPGYIYEPRIPRPKPNENLSENIERFLGLYNSGNIFLTQSEDKAIPNISSLFLHEVGHRYYLHSSGQSIMMPAAEPFEKYAPAFLESRARMLESKTPREGFLVEPKEYDLNAILALYEGNRLFQNGEYENAREIFNRGYKKATEKARKRELELSVAYLDRLEACGVWKSTKHAN